MDKQQVLTKMTDAGLVAVVRASNAEDAIRITDACLEGGCPSIELTFTVPGAAKVIEALASKYTNGENAFGRRNRFGFRDSKTGYSFRS